ncbi:MAG: DEAD/DEAH box helicase [Kiritimatiellae bacterium]|nr:DEAD/DEAH box helicase [Kiritimatiellia bacterium]
MAFKRKRRHRHHGFAERAGDERTSLSFPKGPPCAAYEANIFGKLTLALQYAITDAGYVVPTPIQEKAIPDILAGRDLIGCAQTGTGKTAAFMLPILHNLLAVRGPKAPPHTAASHPDVLVLSPTRELAAQTAENTSLFSKYTNISYAVIFGGVSQAPQEAALRRGAEIAIATPGRLIDLMSQGFIFLDKVRYFVLDEADRMLDMGFMPDIKRIISKLPFPENRQNLFFSATMAPEVIKLANELVRNPVHVTIEPDAPAAEKIAQKVFFVDKPNKDALLRHLLENHPEWRKVIVFTRTRHGADRVERKLKNAEIATAAIHSDKTQNQRLRALKAFKDGKIRVLTATDIASRGLDIPRVSLVVNMDVPVEQESYVHRIGRTARAGESGEAISLVSAEERIQFRAIERFVKRDIPIDSDHPFHSEAAQRACGKSGEGLPTAPWAAASKRKPHPANAKRHKRKRKNFAGRNQPDFGKKGE